MKEGNDKREQECCW